MEIKWTNEAIESLRDNLNYWTNRNFSPNYSNKIIDEVEAVEKEIKENPYFLTSFIEEVKLYKRVILKGKFALYYDIIDEEELVIIKFFRSTKQKTL